MPAALRISVVVPTRNRAEHAAECAREILRSDGFDEIVFVDQSDGSETERALAAIGDGRIRRVACRLRGATNGRNLGIEATTGDVIAFTDDDCRVASDWISSIAAVFASDPSVALVCGRVRVPDELRARGFAVEFEPDVREWVGRFPPPDRDWGITANMAVRRDVFARVGPFDAMLGAGAPLLSGEEPDLIFRVLKAGLKVVNAREVGVTHLGVRLHGPEATQLWRTYGRGTAAALFKHVRLGDTDAAAIYLRHLGVLGRVMAENVVRGRRPLGLGYTLAFLSGAVASFRYRVDRQRRLYVAP